VRLHTHDLAIEICLSVCLSVHCDIKTKETSVHIFVSYERSIILFFRQEEWLEVRPLVAEILGLTDAVRAKTPIFNRYSLVAPQP